MQNSLKQISEIRDGDDSASQKFVLTDLESLAGTWKGEPLTDKVILLRGGKGFVVYKNGATMNVNFFPSKTDDSGNILSLRVNQVSAVNPAFYPDIPKESVLAALKKNPDAKIFWNFEPSSVNVLSGAKSTLVPSGGGAKFASVKTVWKRQE